MGRTNRSGSFFAGRTKCPAANVGRTLSDVGAIFQALGITFTDLYIKFIIIGPDIMI